MSIADEMPSSRWWSVAFVVDDAEANLLSERAIREVMHPKGVRSISVGTSGVGESEQVASLKLELQADGATEAKERAEGLLYAGRRAAGLPDAVAEIAWVTPLSSSESSSVRFLEKAEELLDDEDNLDLAVVAAQIHLEVQVRTLIEHAAEDEGPPWIDVLLSQRGLGNLNNKQTQALIVALLGFDVTTSARWKDYRAHNVRRNAIVHEGQDVLPEEANLSVTTVRALSIELADAAMNHRLPG
jgi:hypothetical protein